MVTKCFVLFILIVFEFYTCILTVSANFFEKPCASLYDSEKYTGNNLVLVDGQNIIDFKDHYLSASQELWNATKSVKITQGCIFSACNESYHDGFCKVFQSKKRGDGGLANLIPELRSIGSANCTCPTVCKCSDVQLRSSECARAYVSGGCNTCGSYYLDFREEKPYIDEAFKNKISSCVIRPGCELEVFDEEDFDGDSRILDGIVQDWDKEISSYKCTCTNDFTQPRRKTKTRPTHYPPLVDVPNTVDAIKELLSQHEGHPGLISSLQSIKNKRSPKNAYILLLGLTGSGKSSAINLLFDNPNVTRVGSGSSVTSDIHEFRISVPVDEFGIQNSELRVIDTPGLSDTRGLEQDARFLATLEEYLTNHEELSKYVPNVVLIFSKFSDNRFNGPGANFVKMLRGFDLLQDRLVDKKFSNVVFVLSHFMSEMRKITRRPGPRLNEFKKTIEDFSLTPKPITIVVAENKARDEGLEMLNGYYKLPNGDFYPQNLFDKIQFAAKSGGDPIGEAIVRTAFKNSDSFNVSSSTFSLVNSRQTQVLKYLRILSGATFTVNDTEVSRILATGYESISDTMKRQFPDALPYLQRLFNIRNIHLRTDVPGTNVGILKLLKEIRLNAASVSIMENALSLKIPELTLDVMTTGAGYDAINDTPLLTSPFKSNSNLISDMVFKIPDYLTCRILNDKKSIYRTFKNSDEYYEFRLLNLNVHYSGSGSGFRGTPKPGYNVLSTTDLEYTVSAVQEYRHYELVLNDNFELTQEFVTTLRDLPPFNQSDYDGIVSWRTFFRLHGTHVVRSAHGGGSIEIQLTTTDPSSKAVAAAMFDILEAAEDVTARQTQNRTEHFEYTLKFKGGDFKYHLASFSGMSAAAVAGLIERWKDSIQYNPVVLDSDIKLLPISEVAKKVGLNISAELQRAALELFNSTLVYRPPEVDLSHTHTTVPPEARENVRLRLAEIQDSNNQFSTLIDVAREEFQTSKDRFEWFLSEMKRRSAESKRAREKELAEEQEWRNAQDRRREAARIESLRRDLNRTLELNAYRDKMLKEIRDARNRNRIF